MKFFQIISQEKNKILEHIILHLSLVFLVILIIFALLIGATKNMSSEIILLVRLPRIIAAIFAGAALAGCGLILQNIMGNPLAGPNIIGVNSGAAFATVIATVFFQTNSIIQPIFAFIGAFLVILCLYILSKKNGISKMTIILFGVAMNSLFNALTDCFYTFFPNIVSNHVSFKIGGLSSLNINVITPAIIIIALVLLLVYFKTPQLEILSLGDETAHALGLSVKSVRFYLLIFAASLAGAAVSFSGIIGFIGLIIPHCAKFIIHTGIKKLYLLCILWGSILLLFCDTLARTLFRPFELPVGILLSFIGVPIFFWILINRNGRGF
ncbi:MAG: FecCD family ABC transporter permease [Lachnospiraceae bacterium]